jgi:predicted lactoylglutathione lyase
MGSLLTKQSALMGIIGLVVGVVAILGIRLATYTPPEKVHYHANFAVFINGTREQFKGSNYYEEISAPCTVKPVETPGERAHMHDNVNDVVHVEDAAATWGNFFQNLGWNIDKGFIKSDQALYQADEQNKLVFILNGEVVSDITNKVIGDRDKLLVSYGSGQDTKQQLNTVGDTAKKYDVEKDPAGCSGSAEPTLKDRLMHLL